MLAAFSGFAQGLGAGLELSQDRKRQMQEDERYNRYLDRMEANNASYSPMGASRPAGGGYGTAGAATAGGGGNATLFGLIDKTEGAGNYDTLFGHSQNGGRFNGIKVSDMTLAQLYDFSDPSGEYGQWVKGEVGRVATPMGRHQIVGTTLRNAATEMGLSPDTKFTPQTQDAIAAYLARERLEGVKSPAAKRAALRAEWEGFKHVSDADLDTAIAQFEANGGILTPRPRGVGPM